MIDKTSIDSQMLSEQLELLITIIGEDKESILWGLVNMMEEIQDEIRSPLHKTNIIWASPDGSWGGCKRSDLIIVCESDLTDDERDIIADGEVYEVLLAVEARKVSRDD